jgi:hypothetical protein
MTDETTAQPQSQPPNGDNRPASLPEKFKTPEDMAKAYADVERKLSRGESKQGRADQPQESQARSDETTDETSDRPDTDRDTPARSPEAPQDGQQQQHQEGESALKAKGLSFSEYRDEIMRNGSLSDASYEALEAAGFDRAMVNGYVEGQRAVAERQVQTVFDLAGGSRDSYQETVEWIKETMAPDELAAYNAVMDSNDLGAIKVAAKGLRAQYLAANPAEPERFIGGERPRGEGTYAHSRSRQPIQ